MHPTHLSNLHKFNFTQHWLHWEWMLNSKHNSQFPQWRLVHTQVKMHNATYQGHHGHQRQYCAQSPVAWFPPPAPPAVRRKPQTWFSWCASITSSTRSASQTPRPSTHSSPCTFNIHSVAHFVINKNKLFFAKRIFMIEVYDKHGAFFKPIQVLKLGIYLKIFMKNKKVPLQLNCKEQAWMLESLLNRSWSQLVFLPIRFECAVKIYEKHLKTQIAMFTLTSNCAPTSN